MALTQGEMAQAYESMAPRVFVSHASEDKSRFVLAFAKQLREKGIDAWVDQWEIRPGDSLVDKIFEQGIGDAHAILIILSLYSIEKLWVKQELNVSVVNRIQKGTRIIPIILDNLTLDQIPEALKDLLHMRITTLDNYDAVLKDIIDTIYEDSNKPALGIAPAYIRMVIDQVPGLSRIDSLILKFVGEKAIENEHRFRIQTQEILDQVVAEDIALRNFYESLTVLGDSHYLELTRVFGGEPIDPVLREVTRGGIPHFSVTILGFESYAKTYIAGYQSIVKSVISQIVNEGKRDSESIEKAINQPLRVVEHVLEMLDQRGEIRLIREQGPRTTHFLHQSARLRRYLEQDGNIF